MHGLVIGHTTLPSRQGQLLLPGSVPLIGSKLNGDLGDPWVLGYSRRSLLALGRMGPPSLQGTVEYEVLKVNLRSRSPTRVVLATLIALSSLQIAGARQTTTSAGS